MHVFAELSNALVDLLTRQRDDRPMNRTPVIAASFAAVLALAATACGSAEDDSNAGSAAVATVAAEATEIDPEAAVEIAADESAQDTDGSPDSEANTEAVAGATSTYEIAVWADNWMAVYIDGQLIGEDSVPITTERSFNAETFSFEAALPFTVAIEAKDFKETDSGIEYIGDGNQQMGDGGIIAQITDLTTGEVVAGTDAGWAALVVHQAPLNTECVRDADPDSTCEFLTIDTPADWASVAFDDSGWSTATEWSEADVSPKDGYDEINWGASAQLIWGTDLEVDNTVLLRATIS